MLFHFARENGKTISRFWGAHDEMFHMLGETDEGPIGIVDEAGLRNGNGSCANEPSFSTQVAEHRFMDSGGGEYRLHGYLTSRQFPII
jgi:hypothetical protein